MELTELAKIGGPVVAAIIVFGVIIFQIIKVFLRAAEKRDAEFTTFIKIQQADTKELITNHLAHDSQLHEQTIKTMGQMETTLKDNTLTMREVLTFLKNNKRK